MKNLHVVPHDDGWAIKQEGEDGPIAVCASQDEAVDRGEAMARDREVNLVVHRENGAFDHVENHEKLTNGGRERADGRPAVVRVPFVGEGRLHLEDVASVGSRVSWGALMAGVVTALAIYVALGTLGVAIGLSTAGTAVEGNQLYVGAAIWAGVSLLVSLFLGGYVTSRCTVGEQKEEAPIYGVLLWGSLFAAVAILTSIGLNLGVAGMMEQAALPNAGLALSEAQLRDAGATQQVIDDVMEMQAASNNVRATTAAWWAFASIIASIAASIGGAVVGAGPVISLEAIRQRRDDRLAARA